MKLDELSDADRRQISEGRANLAKARIAPLTGQYGSPARYHCHTCRERFTAWASAERHADETGHRRIELDIEQAAS